MAYILKVKQEEEADRKNDGLGWLESLKLHEDKLKKYNGRLSCLDEIQVQMDVKLKLIGPRLDKMKPSVKALEVCIAKVEPALLPHESCMPGIVTNASYLDTCIIDQATHITDVENEHWAQVTKQENAMSALRTTIASSQIDNTFHPITNS